MLSTETHLKLKHICRVKVNGWKKMESKGYFMKIKTNKQKSWGSNTYNIQNRLKKKVYKKRQRRTQQFHF